METLDTEKTAELELAKDGSISAAVAMAGFQGSNSEGVLATPLKLKINTERHASAIKSTSDQQSTNATDFDSGGCPETTDSSLQDGPLDTDTILELDLQDVDSQALFALNEELQKILDPKVHHHGNIYFNSSEETYL